MVMNHSKKGGERCLSVLMGHRGWVYWAMAAGKMGKVGESGEKWGAMGEYVSFFFFQETEWENGDKPPLRRWKVVVFSLVGHRGWVYWAMAGGKLGKNFADIFPQVPHFFHFPPFPSFPHFSPIPLFSHISSGTLLGALLPAVLRIAGPCRSPPPPQGGGGAKAAVESRCTASHLFP